jgi:hypothetical protein
MAASERTTGRVKKKPGNLLKFFEPAKAVATPRQLALKELQNSNEQAAAQLKIE